jgi:hypothetical protein
MGVDTVLAVALAAVEVALELPALLEPPQPASRSATPARARIEDLGTGFLLLFGATDVRGFRSQPCLGRRSPRFPSSTHGGVNARLAVARFLS